MELTRIVFSFGTTTAPCKSFLHAAMLNGGIYPFIADLISHLGMMLRMMLKAEPPHTRL